MTVAWEVLTAAVGPRYALDRELGQGAMATVYLAHEVPEGRPVAIKVMHPGLAAALGAERFRREIKVVGALSHPNIVPLRDPGTAGPILYYVMPFIEGESLFRRLQRERRLPLGTALQLTRDVAAGLGYAHGHGILHRDVKPENILLADGRALVADFGLARAIGAADTKQLTATGVVVGTSYYLSPEQLREDRDIDQRADIYGLGCVLYEMLTGGPPYTGRSLTDVVTQILRAPVPSVRQVDPGIPPAVDEAIGRALAKSAAARFTTMEEFAAALPQLGGGPS